MGTDQAQPDGTGSAEIRVSTIEGSAPVDPVDGGRRAALGSPFVTAVSGFPIRAAHFVERHGLIVLIALGESIVAVGIGMAGHRLRADRVVTAALGGIVVFAAGVKHAVGRSGGPVASTAWLLAGGVATCLLGLALFRRLLGIGPIGARVAVAGAVLPSAVVGLAISPVAQLGVLALLVAGGVLTEPAWERHTSTAAGGQRLQDKGGSP
ncbi:MAG TPA: low temperature requirement protein A [Asanoa sp.]